MNTHTELNRVSHRVARPALRTRLSRCLHQRRVRPSIKIFQNPDGLLRRALTFSRVLDNILVHLLLAVPQLRGLRHLAVDVPDFTIKLLPLFRKFSEFGLTFFYRRRQLFNRGTLVIPRHLVRSNLLLAPPVLRRLLVGFLEKISDKMRFNIDTWYLDLTERTCATLAA